MHTACAVWKTFLGEFISEQLQVGCTPVTLQNQAQTLSGETHHQPRPQKFQGICTYSQKPECQNIVGV